MTYQLGYNAGFTNGNWQTRQRQVWEAAGSVSASSAPSDNDDDDDDDAATVPATAMATSPAEIDLDAAAASAPHGLVLAPPVVLNGKPSFGALRVVRAHPAPRALSLRVEPKS